MLTFELYRTIYFLLSINTLTWDNWGAQAFAQMRITEAGAHLSAFSGILKEEQRKQHGQYSRIMRSNITWITAAAVAAADAMLEACPSVYERRCLLQLLSAEDFADGGLAAIRFRKLYWKMQLAEPALGSGSGVVANGSELEDDALLQELENNGQWEEARSWAGQLDLSSQRSSAALHHVTEIQVWNPCIHNMFDNSLSKTRPLVDSVSSMCCFKVNKLSFLI
jgi:spatacsin